MFKGTYPIHTELAPTQVLLWNQIIDGRIRDSFPKDHKRE